MAITRPSAPRPILVFALFLASGCIFGDHNHNLDLNNNNNNNPLPCLGVSAMTSKATTSSSYRGALIFLHGLGDSPRGWSGLEQSLPRLKPSLGDIKYVFPAAPTIPITINGGMSMPGWFDLYDWPIGVGSRDDPAGLKRGVAQIREEVARLETDHGIPPEKIVIGGFSQGGAVALLSCYHQVTGDGGETGAAASPKRAAFAGCVGLSAWLTLPKEVVADAAAAGGDDPRKTIPLFWGHGTYDDKVLFEQQKFGIETLANDFGLDHGLITHTQYPMGHQSCEPETRDLADFVDRVLFGSDDDGAKADL